MNAGAGVLVGAGAAAIPVDDWVAVDLAHPDADRSPGSPRWRAVSLGDTIRLTIGDQLQGDAILLGAGSAELVVAGIVHYDTVVVPIATVRRAEVARGFQPGERFVGRASLVGAGAGFLLGSGFRTNRTVFGILGGGVGAALGGVVGMVGTIRPEPNWVPFDPASMTVAAAPSR